MEQKLLSARIVAGILAVIVVICLIVIWNDQQAIAKLKSPGNNITATADTVRADCSSTDPVVHAKCGDDLQNLSDLLAQFSKTLPTTAPAQ